MEKDKIAPSKKNENALVAISLIGRINAEHAACVAAASHLLDRAMNCGDLLAEAKNIVPRGQWQEWLGENFEGSARSARSYMQLAENRELLATMGQQAAITSLREAFRLIAPPPPDSDEPSDAAPTNEANPSVIPAKGTNLVFRREFSDGMEALFIEHSSYEGFFYVTRVRTCIDREYGDNDAVGLKRPIREDEVFSTCLSYGGKTLLEKGERIELADAPPLQFNPWLYDSYEQHLERQPIEEQLRAERSDGEGEIVIEDPSNVEDADE